MLCQAFEYSSKLYRDVRERHFTIMALGRHALENTMNTLTFKAIVDGQSIVQVRSYYCDHCVCVTFVR